MLACYFEYAKIVYPWDVGERKIKVDRGYFSQSTRLDRI